MSKKTSGELRGLRVSGEAFCSGATDHVDWAANVIGLVECAADGCSEEKTGVMQFDLPGGGRRVEIQMFITDNEDDFIL